jgi:CheY-like chemotaxis protein
MKKKSILIVEDEAVTAKSLEKAVESFNYRISGVAATGEEANELAGKTRPDLVLMDIQLGAGIDGIEAAKRIAAVDTIPLIYATAHSDEATLARVRQPRLRVSHQASQQGRN